MAKKPAGKAGQDDVPANVREGRAAERTEKAINRANESGKTPAEKLEELLRDD
jgi:hypothetical protein